MEKVFKAKLSLRKNIHSHPGWTEKGPSGFRMQEHAMKNSDRKMADFALEYFPNAIFKVYQVRTQEYIRYDGQKIH
ncbi:MULTISPECIES: hypothetical protein [Sphingobacterium]|uniref:Uncharacterized protein n=1 Tax=Sphingobacterium populi TaxID=1812824 RepID=A0ABW5UGP2_9SPHI|nr:hypothetical protein [Sphingobacterium sp. CFCC 11742]